MSIGEEPFISNRWGYLFNRDKLDILESKLQILVDTSFIIYIYLTDVTASLDLMGGRVRPRQLIILLCECVSE